MKQQTADKGHQPPAASRQPGTHDLEPGGRGPEAGGSRPEPGGWRLEAGGSWQPRIIAFLCNWCSYAGADLAGMSRLAYPAAIRVIRVPCSGRVDPMFVLKSFERGADMVLVSGCHPGDCHYTSGNYHARRKLLAFRELLSFMGIDPRRFKMSWVSAAEGAKWSALVKEITEEARALGPFEAFPSAVVQEAGR